jgi:UDP-3-O-[3-hydroxymyristoyl] glucosamine N-acyltransferase
MIYTIGKIAEILNGRVVGDSNFKIIMLSKIEEGSKGSLSFLANEKYEDFLYTTKASAVIVNSNLDIDKTKVSTNLIIVEDAYQSFAFMLDEFSKSRNKIEGIHKTASIEESASLGKKCFIGSNVHISDNVNIGDNVKIYIQGLKFMIIVVLVKNASYNQGQLLEVMVLDLRQTLIMNTLKYHK